MHYHVLLWLPKGYTIPKPDKQGWWKHGMTRTEWARHPIGYLSKYASKGEGDDHCFPKGARIHATGGLEGVHLDELRWWRFPSWLRQDVSIGEKVKRRIGGGWLNYSTGEEFESPWKVIFNKGRVWLFLREELLKT